MIKFSLLEVKDVNEFRKCEARCFKMNSCKDMNYVLIPLIKFGWVYKTVDIKTNKIVGGLIAFHTSTYDCYIHSLFVLPKYRQQNIGKMLMSLIMERFSGMRFILEVNPKNTHAIKFYKKLGFKISETVKNYFLDGEDRHLMYHGEYITL